MINWLRKIIEYKNIALDITAFIGWYFVLIY